MSIRLTFLPTLSQTQFARLCESGARGGMSPVEVSENVLSGAWKCFEIGDDLGLVAVSVGSNPDRVMHIQALWSKKFGQHMRSFRTLMDRLATEWKCNTVETICFDSRIMVATLMVGAQPVSWQMRWQVKGMES